MKAIVSAILVIGLAGCAAKPLEVGSMTSAGSAGGVIGVVATAAIAGIVDASSDNTNNVWHYPPAKIDLEPLEKKAAPTKPKTSPMSPI